MSRSPSSWYPGWSKKKSKKKSKKRSKDHAGVVCKKPKKSALALEPSEASPGQVDNTWIDNLNKLTSELRKGNKKKRKKNKGTLVQSVMLKTSP